VAALGPAHRIVPHAFRQAVVADHVIALEAARASMTNPVTRDAQNGAGSASERLTSNLPRGPLSRYTVLDLSRVRAGPTAVRQLADWGARCIRVEQPRKAVLGDALGKDRNGPDFQNLHRNKESLSLDLKQPKGREILLKLVKRADVLVENFRPKVKFRLGIDYENVRAINPRLVYASISGFGQSGPYADRPGFDQIAKGMGGLMSITGAPGQGPLRAGIPVADLSAGHYCALGILIALLERETTGQGQWVQTSLLQAQVAMLDFQATRWLMKHERPVQMENDHPTIIPTGCYRAKDGYINIGTAGQEIFDRLCRSIDAPELARNPAFATATARSRNRVLLNASIAAKLGEKTVAEWVDILTSAGVPAGPVLNVDQVFDDPQVHHLGMAQPVKHKTLGTINILGQGVALSHHPFHVRSASLEPGEHTDTIRNELGYDGATIEDLRGSGVV
jgi:formyl-CoA transferase